MVKELKAEQVRLKCNPAMFKCDSTGDLAPYEGIIGQDRALSALKFGLNIQKPGFNILCPVSPAPVNHRYQIISGYAGHQERNTFRLVLCLQFQRRRPAPCIENTCRKRAAIAKRHEAHHR